MSVAEHKSETLNLRVSPQFKAALQAAARRERRSMANMVEYLVLAYCEEHQLVPPSTQDAQIPESTAR